MEVEKPLVVQVAGEVLTEGHSLEKPAEHMLMVALPTLSGAAASKLVAAGKAAKRNNDPRELKDYQGARTSHNLKKSDEKNIGPSHGPGENLVLCDAETDKEEDLQQALGVSEWPVPDWQSELEAGLTAAFTELRSALKDKPAT